MKLSYTPTNLGLAPLFTAPRKRSININTGWAEIETVSIASPLLPFSSIVVFAVLCAYVYVYNFVRRVVESVYIIQAWMEGKAEVWRIRLCRLVGRRLRLDFG